MDNKMDNKILIAYYSRSGKTKSVANIIQNIVNGTVVEIIPEEAYPTDYNTVVDQAKKEISSGFKPALKTKIDNINDYDIIFIGSPNWWSTIAPPITTFLSEYDLSGKTVVPFATHGGGGDGHMIPDLKALCPNSKVLESICIRDNDAEKSESKISDWLKKIGLAE
ncbi:hypothetical protein MmiHf6_08470 [Methanimicrococcus hongohii]|uniref:Flavodoxin-like domain-containing protein n=1 Tax=Methanimicrococcus hongohii TaxID=3028295 RepID=A0AA96V1W7_9EURY|nr:flavodoxin [Methanimicrococcus sp. Hf6]WNY23538.1 hypothetical protein MmiHf6_08470 [Methanimicrococcus sp. Hf6]